MTPRRRELIFKLADGNMDALRYIHQFERLVHAETFYKYLIDNHITGKTFVEYYEKKFQFSFKAFTEWLIQAIEKNREQRPAFFGRDIN